MDWFFRIVAWCRERSDIETRHRREVEELRHQLKLREDDVRRLQLTLERELQRVEYETKAFVRRGEDALHDPRFVGGVHGQR